MDAVAAAHKHRVGQARPRVIHRRDVELALGQKAHGERQQDVLGTRARRGGVGVEVLQRHVVSVLVGLRRRPVDKVLGGAALDGPHPTAGAVEVAAEEAIAPNVRVPQGDVDRVEGSRDVQGAVFDRSPVEAIGRGKAVQVGLARAAHGFEALRRIGRGITVEKDAEIVALVALDKDIVFARAIEFDQAQFRLRKVDAIGADGQVSGLVSRAVGVVRANRIEASIVQEDAVPILGEIVAARAGIVPGLGDLIDHFAADGRVQVQSGPIEVFNEEVIDE